MAGYPEKTERNNQIYADYKAGMSYTQLVIKYQRSQKVIFEIIKRMKARENADNAPDK